MKKKDNILSIHTDSSSRSEKKEPRFRSKYIPPLTAENPSEFYKLPSSEEILNDFKLCGGCFELFLERCVGQAAQRKVVAMQIIEQLGKSEAHIEEFEAIRASAERAEALLARDTIIALSRQKSNSQLTALKLVQAFAAEHRGKVVDAMDKHLENVPDEK